MRYAIYYSGASGGFMFYYSLYLALGHDVSEDIEKNWDIPEYSSWRQSERLVDSDVVELNCNVRNVAHAVDVTTLTIYTDISTQLALAELKAAKWFYDPADWSSMTRENVITRVHESAVKFNNMDVYPLSKQLINAVDHSFLLQDVIKTKFKCVTDALGLEYTQAVADHIDKWVTLHPENIQELFYK